jgi:hypothetical protein
MFIRLFIRLININWLSFRPADCFPRHCFCEHIGLGFVRQPVDAYSNVIYVLVGLFIIFSLLFLTKNKIKISPYSNLPRRLIYVFAFSSILVGIGSFMYHAGFTFFGEQMDDDSMYLVGSFLLLFNISHLKKISLKKFLLFYLLINLLCEILIYIHPVVRGALFGLLLISALSLENSLSKTTKIKKQIEYLTTAVKLFALAYFIWILDYTRIFCHPYSLFQGHAIWHILTGISILFLFFSMDVEYTDVEYTKE